jgi:hypothetical protein
MLNPDEFNPTVVAKKKVLKKRLIKSDNSKTRTSAVDRAHDKQISDIIKRETAPPPNKPAYKAPATPPLSTKKNGKVFNPKAKIDKSQVEDRVQSDYMDKFVNRLASHKSFAARNPGSNFPVPKKPKTTMGTRNKEALLKRLREKGQG